MTDTQTICEIGPSGFWTGQSRAIGALDGCPPTWVATATPPSQSFDPTQQGWAWIGGAWVLTNLPAASLASQQAAKSKSVDARRDAILTGGFSHDFGGTVGVKVLQTATTDDDTNWLTLQNSCIAASIAGQGATAGAVIRTLDNVNVPLSYSDCLQVLLAMSAWGAAVYAASWTLKDAVTAAADLPTLNAIDITQGWPANP